MLISLLLFRVLCKDLKLFLKMNETLKNKDTIFNLMDTYALLNQWLAGIGNLKDCSLESWHKALDVGFIMANACSFFSVEIYQNFTETNKKNVYTRYHRIKLCWTFAKETV